MDFSSLLVLLEVWSVTHFASVEGDLFSEAGDLFLGLQEERYCREGGSGGTLGCGPRAELVWCRSVSSAPLWGTGQTVRLERASETTHSIAGGISVLSRPLLLTQLRLVSSLQSLNTMSCMSSISTLTVIPPRSGPYLPQWPEPRPSRYRGSAPNRFVEWRNK